MILTPHDLNSQTWKTLETYLADRLASLRERNDGLLAEPDRNRLIGQIAEVKIFQRLATPDPVLE